MKVLASLAGGAALLAIPVVTVLFMAPQASGAQLAAPTGAAVADIPAPMLALYVEATAQRCPGLAWPVLAAIGKVETDHARNVAVSSAGALGPMQFMPPTWAAYGVDGDRDGVIDVMNPADAVHGAANYLCASGAGNPATLRNAIFAYNRAGWYVDKVLDQASVYAQVAGTVEVDATGLVGNPRLVLTPSARGDLEAGLIDARVVTMLAALSEQHTIAVSVLRTGHTKHVANTTRISNHWCGQAADIWMIDGVRVSSAHGTARAIAEWMGTLQGPLRPSEIGTPWADLRGPGYFSDAMHQGHLHVGYGPRCTD